MYNYGPGQSNPGGQFPDNSANSPYGSPQPQYQQQPQDPNAYQQQPQDPNAYQQQPQDPNAYQQQPPNPYQQQPQVSPTQPYDPSQAMTSGVPASPAAPQYGVAVPTAPVTGPGPLDQTMFGTPNPMLMVPPKKKSLTVPILAGVSALLLVGTVIFLVLFLSAKGDLTEARATIGENEEKLEDLEAAEKTADESSDCVKLVEDMFGELDAGSDPAELQRILEEMETTCEAV